MRPALSQLACALGAALAAASCRLPAPAAPAEDALAPGFHERTLALPAGQTLRYTLFIPEGDPGRRRRPLVLALHFGGEVTPFYGRGILEVLVRPGLSELGAVLVAPDALDGGWNDPLDEGAVLALLDHLGATLSIDRRRVLCTGYSMGGVGAWYLGARHPDRFAAAIPVAGRPLAELDVKIPVYAIHGRQDQVMPLAPTEAYVNRLRAAGGKAELVVVDGPTHYETDRFVGALRAAVPWIRQTWAGPRGDYGRPEDAFESAPD